MTRRLSPLDLAFFVLESAARPMNVGPLIVLEPPAGQRGRRFAEALYEAMLARPVGAPFNLRLASSAASLPRLAADEAFDLSHHVHRIRLARPGTRGTLVEKVCTLHAERLDRARPLWAFYLIEGLEGGRVALYAKMHHGIIDGAGFVKVISHWLARSRDEPARAMWEGVPAATGTRREQPSLVRRVGMLLRESAGTALSLSRMLWQQGLSTLGTGGGPPLPFTATPPVLKVAPSAARSFAHCALSLAAMKAAGKACGATVNDVLLCVLDIALRRYLARSDAEPSAPLIVDMPVALPATASQGNRIAMVQLRLGARGIDPAQRLARIAEQTRVVKGQIQGAGSDAAVLHSILAHGLPSAMEALHLDRAPLLANLVVSNPFGFAEKRYLMGAEVELILPVSVVAPGQVLNITGVNYGERYQIAFLAIAEALPEIERLAQFTEEAFAELAAALGVPRDAVAAKDRGRKRLPTSRQRRTFSAVP